MQTGTWRRAAVGVAIAALVAGCGTQSPTKPKKNTAPAGPAAPGGWVGDPAQPAQPGVAKPGDDPAARAAIARTIAAVTAMPAYQLEMRWMQKAGSKTAKGIYDIAGRAPRSLKIEIREGHGQGTKVLYTGGEKAKVRPDGLLGAITVDLSINDDRLLSVRNYNIPQTDLPGLMGQLGDASHVAKLVKQTADTVAVEVSGGPLLKGCVKMVLEADAATGLPKIIDQYDAREVVFHLDIRNFRAKKNVDLSI